MMYYSNTKFYCHSQLDLEGTGSNSNFFSIWKYAKGIAYAEVFRNGLQNLIHNIDDLLALDSVRRVHWRPWSSCQTTRLTRTYSQPCQSHHRTWDKALCTYHCSTIKCSHKAEHKTLTIHTLMNYPSPYKCIYNSHVCICITRVIDEQIQICS